MAKTKKNVFYGSIELDEDEFSSRYEKIRITTFVDLDVVTALKKRAKKLGIGYQTLLNDILRKKVVGESSERIDFDEILKRLEHLETKVG